MITRRKLLGQATLGAGMATLVGCTETRNAGSASSSGNPLMAHLNGPAERLYETIATYPADDTHCHAVTRRDWAIDGQTTADLFLLRISLVGFGVSGYFPSGVFQQWLTGDADERRALDKQHGVAATVREVSRHFGESVFVKYMVKEMAQFLGCQPTLNEVIEARNARAGSDYPKYMRDLYAHAKIENLMTDTGCCGGAGAADFQDYAKAIEPTSKYRGIARVDSLQRDLMAQDLSFDDLTGQFVERVRETLDGTANQGFRTYGMKSRLMPRLGLIRPVHDKKAAAESWQEYRRTRALPAADREERGYRGRVISEHLLTLALEECLERDMPMQFHAGDGEAPGAILRIQHPYYLEEFVRFDKDGVMRRPKIIPIHAGYPLVGEATWLSHLYTNCYYEFSIMSPFVHQGLEERFREVMEAVPFSKMLHGSDAYNVPEINWLAALWSKRFMSQALATYVSQGLLTHDEALEGARRTLYENNREVYRIDS